jgi:imidazolonepropionase-like amidohydrolase
MRSIVPVVAWLCWCTPGICQSVDGQVEVWRARQIWTGEGQPVQDAVMVTEDGKVRQVGPADSVRIPAGARIHDLGNHVIIPGLVVAETGLVDSSDAERTLTPEIQALHGFDFYADRQDLLAAGVTTAQISPGNNRLMPGMGAVVKLAGDDIPARTLSDRESLRIVLDVSARNPPTIFEPQVGAVSVDRPLEPAQPQLSKTLPGMVAGLRTILGSATAERRYVTRESQPVVETVAAHVNGGGVFRFTATTPAEVRAAVDLANQYTLRALLVDCSGLDSVADFDAWKSRIRGVILKGRSPGKISNPDAESLKDEQLPWAGTRRLIDAGLPVAIRPAADADLKQLLFVAGQFMQADLQPAEVLSMLTSWPARMLGVADRVGTLTPGKDADFVVLSDTPFRLRTAVTATYVNGRRVFDSSPDNNAQVIRASQIYTGTGEVLNDGMLVVKGHTLRGIGSDISAPLQSPTRDFGDAVIVPGFVDLGTGLGLGGELSGNVPLNTRLGEVLYGDDPSVRHARKSGVTTALLGALATNGPTPLIAFKLGDDVRVVADPVAIWFRMGENPAVSVESFRQELDKGKAYMDSWKRYEQELAAWEAAKTAAAEKTGEKADAAESSGDADNGEDKEPDSAGSEDARESSDGENPESGRRESGRRGERPGSGRRRPGPRGGVPARRPGSGTGDQKQGEDGEEKEKPQPPAEGEDADEEDEKKEEQPENKPPEKPEVKPELEPYRTLFAGDIPVFVEARKANAIEAALQLFCDQYQLRTVLVGADDLARFPDLLQNHDVAVCAGPDLVVKVDEREVNLPQVLSNEQVPFGFLSKGTTGSAMLPAAIQFSVAQGLGVRDGLQALTATSARVLSEALNFGRLETGRDADLVVLSGPPFEYSSKVLAVMIDGKWVYEQEDQ